MARKRKTKAGGTKKSTGGASAKAQGQQPAISADKRAIRDRLSESIIKSLIEKGKKKGYLTYEEMNEDLPDEAISPNRLDSLLMTLDDLGVQLLDEAEVAKKEQEERVILVSVSATSYMDFGEKQRYLKYMNNTNL